MRVGADDCVLPPRLTSSFATLSYRTHECISYAVFCLTKKKNDQVVLRITRALANPRIAQRLSAQAEEVLKRANDALQRSRDAESQRIIPPVQALNYQRALLDATSLLNLRRQDLEYAKRELAALMNVPPGTSVTVADNRSAPLPQIPAVNVHWCCEGKWVHIA